MHTTHYPFPEVPLIEGFHQYPGIHTMHVSRVSHYWQFWRQYSHWPTSFKKAP